ncbi:cell wall hydrolase/autolysin [Thermoanaerobacter kivui]|uniref:Cell wall hydrolase/autolysin n=1 Tax=Thermoanaerobacter kivui TaxID=2325 RepID=A0A097ATV9_THEKI|nr:N-acetylmuramoyl-L-alanine amidase [Thermoanaerobacter kivui]AIS53240.1 cell wall hydrolase/autolysin [Thermoanaerobacter kivui]
MLNKLTNLRIDSTSSNESIKIHKCLIVFEFSLKVPTYHVEQQNTSIQIIFEDTPLNMPEGKYNVLDGIISYVEIKATEQQIVAEIALDFQTDFEIEIIEGIPAKFKLYISRKPLLEILKDKKILINPGFGEKNTSPTGLLQHIPMMAIAKKLHFLLTTCGAQSRLSWEKSLQEKDLEKFEEGVFIDIFTEASLKKESGFKVYYSDGDENSLKLAKYINECMSQKLQLDNLGICPKSYNYKENVIPIGVVPAMENMRLDDAHLRDLDYRNKVAQAIFNGLVKFYTD